MAVVFIISLLLLLGISRIDFLAPKYRVRAAGRELGARLRYVKSRAITEGRPYYIHYDCGSRRYWVSAPVPVPPEELPPLPPGMTPEEAEKQMGPPPYKYVDAMETVLPDGVFLTDVSLGELANNGVAMIEINPFGTTLTHYIHLADEKRSRETTVKFNGLTGVVTFFDGYQPASESMKEAD